MVTTCQRAIIAACCLVLLFVLVCPYTPSPMPIGKVKMIYFTFTIFMLFSALALFFAEAPSTIVVPRRCHLRLIDITCSRLC
jgi:hypothetical protein